MDISLFAYINAIYVHKKKIVLKINDFSKCKTIVCQLIVFKIRIQHLIFVKIFCLACNFNTNAFHNNFAYISLEFMLNAKYVCLPINCVRKLCTSEYQMFY